MVYVPVKHKAYNYIANPTSLRICLEDKAQRDPLQEVGQGAQRRGDQRHLSAGTFQKRTSLLPSYGHMDMGQN